MLYREIIKGIVTLIPAMSEFRLRKTHNKNTARFCYAVWMRHLVMAHVNGLKAPPDVVAELGPGDSLGVGLAALLSGAEKYYALDVTERASLEKDLTILDELLTLFKDREDIPTEKEFPKMTPSLDSYHFPSAILSEEQIKNALDDNRIERIRRSLLDSKSKNSLIKYFVPWADPQVVQNESVDMVFSQAVLEHVDDLAGTYRAMHSWLKPSGFMSHQIDFKSHGTASTWDGHWTHGNMLWRIIRGRRPYLLNREPHSTHAKLLRENGFQSDLRL